MKLHPIDGNTQWLDGGSMFGNAPKALWEKWLPADTQNRIHLSCRVLLVQTDDGRNILFEAGIGAFFEPKLKERFGVVESEHVLLKRLSELGLKENDIDGVVLSHLHFDHAGGLLPAYGQEPPRLLFPKAKYYLSRQHWERALNPHIRERISFIPVLNKLLSDCDRVVFIDRPEHSDLDFGVSFRFSNGHTIGLMLAEIQLETGPLVFVSDLIPGMPWVHIPITMGFDRFPELLCDEKRALLEYLSSKNGSVLFTHDPKVACARISKDAASDKFIGTPINRK